MGDEIELISDGEGIAVFGQSETIERFLGAAGLSSRELNVGRLGSAASSLSGIAQTGSDAFANSGRWVKLTEESAEALKHSRLMTGSRPTVRRAVLTEDGGKIQGLLEIVQSPSAFLTNPAMLAGAAGIMAQVAMQQTMEEITEYLAAIDAKLDDVLRAQKDAVLADMIGVDLVIAEAMTVREHVGRVSEVTWSKVQATALTIARTQAYALRQLAAIAEEVGEQTKVGDLAEVTQKAKVEVKEWLAVLAHCFQLQDGIAIIELDRVLDSSAEELDRHRIALREARKDRMEAITEGTRALLMRMGIAASSANSKVLLHPRSARSIVEKSNHVTRDVVEFRERLGIESRHRSLEARAWLVAAIEARDKLLETGADGIGAVARVGGEAIDRTRSVAGGLAEDVAKRMSLLRKSVEEESQDARED